MDDLIQTVVARYRRASVSEVQSNLRDFEAAISNMVVAGIPEAKAAFLNEIANGIPPGMSGKERFELMADHQKAAVTASIKLTKYNQIVDPGKLLYTNILRSLVLPPALRKKVEIASRVYAKIPRPRMKARSGPVYYLGMIESYEAYMKAARSHVALAQAAIVAGKEHGADTETSTKVGPFTLWNTGGFSTERMSEIEDLVRKSIAHAQTSGFGEVCYGPIYVTNMIRGARTVAFYNLGKDDMFVRADTKVDTKSVHTFLHELGHRYEVKFLSRRDSAATGRLYRILQGEEELKGTEVRVPKPGDSFEDSSNRTLVVTKTTFNNKGEGVVEMHLKENPVKRFGIPLPLYWKYKGVDTPDSDPNYIGFVTPYAKKDKHENFAEMFAFYCMGKLPVKQSVPFEEIVFGSSKSASERMVSRVAARFL